ncbi:Hypothetical protein LUCI_1802 [Lucifera butyrica]|uniref:HipA-like kinase domain-containing protein n=1 Tax=Lucifera butyrica TaxID=1351585 RepID=A0A498R1S5_9FIRM|nr:HipA family kinase [Lucifera butyrica]VBB06566.1 Hypothetical protein LUCI_1802 [Lucifera butyrica]
MLVAVEYMGPMGVGVTTPQVFRADNHKLYVVKLQKNRMGAKVLVNEWLAARIGQMMELCFPPSDLIMISDRLLAGNKYRQVKGMAPGPHFACQYISSTRYVERYSLSKAINKEQMAGVILFDHLFHNWDRIWNRKNLLIRREKEGYRVYAIDNSHLFRRGVWNIESLRTLAGEIKVNHRRAYGMLLKHFLSARHFQPYVRKFEQITDEELAILVDDIPWEWLPREDEREALFLFLLTRRDMVKEIASRLCSLIPDVHRRTDTD